MAKRSKFIQLQTAVDAAPWISSIGGLVFYAIDKASPYNLALDPRSDTLAKIGPLTFAQLQIDKAGLSLMWTIVNAGLPNYGSQGVPPASASKCKTAADVFLAAQKSTGAA